MSKFNEVDVNKVMQRADNGMDMQIFKEVDVRSIDGIEEFVLDALEGKVTREVETTVDIMQLTDGDGERIYVVGRDDRFNELTEFLQQKFGDEFQQFLESKAGESHE